VSNTNKVITNVKEIKNFILWNCNKIENKIEELFAILEYDNIDIIALNETKLDKDAEFLLENPNYNYFLKSRNKYGGGVGFIVKKDINVELIDELNIFNVELVCIKLIIDQKSVYFTTYYNPPTPGTILKKEIFDYIEKNFENYIICGDFNAKHPSFGCKINNTNGNILNDFLNESNAIILNDKNQFTFFRNHNDYKEILDICICSNNLFSKIEKCFVDYDSDLYSDHLPVRIKFLNYEINKNTQDIQETQEIKHLNYAKANWNLFKEELDKINASKILLNKNPDEINDFFINSILQAAKKTIPYKNNNLQSDIRLPKYVLDLIKVRRRLKKKILRDKCINLEAKSQLYIVNKTIKEEIKAIKDKNWARFSEKFGQNPMSSKNFWRRIQIIKNRGKKKDETYPILVNNNKNYITDIEKAHLFAKILGDTFKDEKCNKFDDEFKAKTDDEIKEFVKNWKNNGNKIESMNLSNLNIIIKKLKNTLSCGEDKISNILLKNINLKFKQVLLHLVQSTITSMVIPDRWKKVIVKMIPKKDDGKIQQIIDQFL
jgi:hypothetical protein